MKYPYEQVADEDAVAYFESGLSPSFPFPELHACHRVKQQTDGEVDRQPEKGWEQVFPKTIVHKVIFIVTPVTDRGRLNAKLQYIF